MFFLCLEMPKGTSILARGFRCDRGLDAGCLRAGMTQRHLYVTRIGAGFRHNGPQMNVARNALF